MKCYKCGYTLGESNYYCPRCGELAIDLKEVFHIIIPLRWCRIIGIISLILAITLYGVCFGIMKKVHIMYFSFSVLLSAIAIVYIARSYDSLAIMKSKNKKNRNKKGYEYCKYCYNKMGATDEYCSMCGYKRR